jgi:hypothetical protein
MEEHCVMKKLFVSLGLAAAGTAGLHAAYAPDAGDASKSWSMAATLRGFYDDNYLTTPHKQGSAGFEVNPSFSLNLPLQQTEIGMRYTYGLYFYQKREQDNQNPIDQTHQFDLWLDHAFTPNWEARIQDTATVSQDPSLTTAATATPQRVEGNNLANTAKASLHTDWTREFSTELSYANTFYDYEQSGATVGAGNTSVTSSYAGSLNRVEQNISLDLQWHVTQTTTALIGYQLGLVNFTGNEPIASSFPVPVSGSYKLYYSNSRDNLSHYGYVGVQHEFSENLKGSMKAGVQYTTYYNDPSSTSSLGPYGDASLVYTYASGSFAQIGMTESRNATETVSVDSNGQITEDQESTVAYGSINQPLTPKLIASLVGHFTYSTYHDGQFNDQSAQFYNVGLDFTYNFTTHFSSDLGYNFDYYTTAAALAQDYTRNRVYLGVTATY